MINIGLFRRKKKVAILANCQGGIYKALLKKDAGFNKKYEFIDLPLVHTLTAQDAEKVYDAVRDLDILFYQPLKAQKFEPYFIENLQKIMPATASVFSIPVLHFNFYAPHTIYMLPRTLPRFDIHELHDLNIVLGWYYGLEKDVLLARLNTGTYYSKALIEKISGINFSRLREREKEIDLKYTDYLESKYKDKVVFHTFNHPTNEVLMEIVSKKASILGLKLEIDEPDFDLLGNVKVGVYPAIRACLHSEDSETGLSYEIQGSQVSMDEMVEQYFRFYDENHVLVKQFVENTLFKTEDKIEELLIDNFLKKHAVSTEIQREFL
jgi:hypothetical protein